MSYTHIEDPIIAMTLKALDEELTMQARLMAVQEFETLDEYKKHFGYLKGIRVSIDVMLTTYANTPHEQGDELDD